ncbi:MAG: helix-turn-helix domain-containing protein [Gemmatimonadota bacterium]|nr:helix-turn-helix domain-containing protein [Gemmatimonadota bacterium]
MEIRERILRAAVKIYGEVGFRGATTRRIAEEAEVNEVTLFRQFGSKSALLHEAVHATGLFNYTPQLPEVPVDPRADLLTWSLAHYDDLVAKRPLIRTCLGECEEHPEILPPAETTALKSKGTLQAYLSTLQSLGLLRADVDVSVATAMLTGILFADAMGRDILPDLFQSDDRTSIAAYLDLLLRAVMAPESP